MVSVTVRIPVKPVFVAGPMKGGRMRPFGMRRLVEMFLAETCLRRAIATMMEVATIAGELVLENTRER